MPAWTYYDPTMKVTSAPVITPSQLTITTSDGRVVYLRLTKEGEQRLERDRAFVEPALHRRSNFGGIDLAHHFLDRADRGRDRKSVV